MTQGNPATKPQVILLSGKSGHGTVEVAAALANLLELKDYRCSFLHFRLDLNCEAEICPPTMVALIDSIARVSSGRHPTDFFILPDVLKEEEFKAFSKALRVRIECADAETRQRMCFVEHRRETPDELGKYAQANLFDMVFSTETEKPEEIARAIVLKLAQGKGPK